MSETVRHTVALNNDQNVEIFKTDRRQFKVIRVIVHSSNVWPSGISENHVSVYLIIPGQSAGEPEKSVRINMQTAPNDVRGFLVWERHNYTMSNSRLAHKDYELGGWMEVRTLYNLIRDTWHLYRYEFSGGGSGCRFWV